MNHIFKNVATQLKTYEETGVLRSAFLVGLFALLTALGALIRIPLPFTPVPITLQTFFVLLSGVMLGTTRGTLSQVAYVTAGAAGLPIFAGMTFGFAMLFGPTGGYLVGFVLAPAVVNYVLSGSSSRWRLVLSAAAGTLVIFLVGNLWLWNLTGGGITDTLLLGFVPFIPGALIKIGLLVAVVEAIRIGRKNR